MPSMDVQPFRNATNIEVINAIRNQASPAFQTRVPAATRATVSDSINSLWTYTPTRNEFVDALMNQIGDQIIRYETWNNPYAKFKRGMLQWGETIEDVAVGLRDAYHYDGNYQALTDFIFSREDNEVQSRFHKVNRRDFYKATVNRDQLQRAFTSEQGLGKLVAGIMSSVNTSDQWDEFLLMSSLFRQNYDNNGFYIQPVPAISNPASDANDAKQFLRTMRELADTLPFISRRYNAAHMPVSATKDQLELFLTPAANAAIDVEALAAAFNLDQTAIPSRITIIPEEQLGIPGAEGILTTKDFFVCADTNMEMQQSQNPAMLHQNYFWHHWETISLTPFVPAILLSSTEQTPFEVIVYPVDGISAITLVDENGNTVTSAVRDQVVQVNAWATLTGSTAHGGVIFDVVGNQSQRTRVTQAGALVIGVDEQATSITLVVTAVDDETFETSITIPITGTLIEGSVGQSVVDNTAVITAKRAPAITPTSGPVGTDFTVDNGTWSVRPDTFAYQWLANGAAIANATADTYTAVAGDAGKTLTVTVTASKAGYSDVQATSKQATVTA